MLDFTKIPLGKKAAAFHPFAPKLANLIHPMAAAPLPPAPPAVDYTQNISPDAWPMYDNDKIGDCTVAAAAHLIQLYTSYTKPNTLLVSQDEVNHVYSEVSGWNPNDPSTDNGAVEANVLNFWMNTGINLAGNLDKIAGYARVNVNNLTELKYAVWWFGGLYIGVGLPAAWQQSPYNWTMPSNLSGANAPGSWGGHAVPVVAYNQDYLTLISWGAVVHMDWQAYQTYADEAWAVISPDFINQQGVTPAHFDWPFLLSSMNRMREGSI